MICTVTASDAGDTSAGITFSLEGIDASKFTISNDEGTKGEVTLIENPDYEARANPIYTFVVRASDEVQSQTQQLTLAINNMDEVAPVFTSPTTITPKREHTGANQVIYTATATNGDVATNPVQPQVTYSLGGTDNAHFTINETSGAVTLLDDPHYETKSVYNFIIIANDGTNTQNLTLELKVDNYSIDFTLSALNSEMTAQTIFQLVDIGNLEETLDMDHLLEFDVLASEWNDIFWLSPDSDQSGADGLPAATTLFGLNVFKAESILYHTKADNLSNANLNYTTTEMATLYYRNPTVLNDITPTELETADTCIKYWSKDIFAQEYMDDIWTNRSAVKTEIDNYITRPKDQVGLMKALRDIVNNANGRSNDDDEDLSVPINISRKNLTRQLLMQLHGGIANTGSEHRLLNTDEKVSIFHPSNQTYTDGSDEYYAFKFIEGDTLSFGMTINHPDQYKNVGSSMEQDELSNDSGVFSGGTPPRAIKFKIKLSMKDSL